MLDGHAYLTKRGWKGKGTALRNGGIAKPLNVSQKRTLSGLGKDRDEAFPFWEHVFNASLNAIKIKIDNSDSESDADATESANTPLVALNRTTTGIISNRRPTEGVSASTSGVATPTLTDSSTSRQSIMATIKRDSVRRQLYARFYRGPLIESLDPPTTPSNTPSSDSPLPSTPVPISLSTLTLTPSSPSTNTPLPSFPESLSKTTRPSNETPKERALRKAEKAERKQQREARRANKLAKKAAKTESSTSQSDNDVPSSKSSKKRKHRDEDSDEMLVDSSQQKEVEITVEEVAEQSLSKEERRAARAAKKAAKEERKAAKQKKKRRKVEGQDDSE